MTKITCALFILISSNLYPQGLEYMRGYGINPETITSNVLFTPLDHNKLVAIDTSYLVCTYKLEYIKNKKSGKQCTDQLIVEIGNKYSISYSEGLKLADSIVREGKGKPGQNTAPPPDDVLFSEVIKNYPTKGMSTIVDRGFHLIVKWNEPINDIKWVLSDGTASYLSYKCQKATCSFRGREYIAWFAPEIPIDNGPWKFGGLPGLILKVTDTKNEYTFECVGIERKEKAIRITSGLASFRKMQRKKFQQRDRAFFRDPVGELKLTETANSKIVLMNMNTNRMIKPAELRIPYNPIELDY